MKDIRIKGREMLVLSVGEEYSMPDNIADQLIKRGKADLRTKEPEPPAIKKIKKVE